MVFVVGRFLFVENDIFLNGGPRLDFSVLVIVISKYYLFPDGTINASASIV